MKKLIYASLLVASLLFGFAIGNIHDTGGMPVRENIVQTENSYSWEQWCWYGNRKVHVGDLKLNGDIKAVGKLETNICD